MKLIHILLMAVSLIAAGMQPAHARRVMVLDIDEEIDATAWRNTSRAASQAREAEPPFDLFVVRLNTYGGAVDMADSIRTTLMKLRVPTVAFIDHNAASAGALIALACDSAYMAPGSSIGAATVVNGSGEAMPTKYQSYWSSVMRSTAMAHGKYVPEGDSVARWRRDPALAADMVRPEKAVSFTTDEAIANGLADGAASNLDDIFADLDIESPQVTYYEPTFTDRLMGFFASAAVRAVLIMLILGGIYMEMHTPGLGVAGAVASVAAVLYFMPMVVGGTLAPWVVILFLIGVVALVLEIFVIPGFGVAGIIGIIAIVASLLGAMLHIDSLTGLDFGALKEQLLVLFAGTLLAILAVLYLTSRRGPKFLRRVATLTTDLTVRDGFVGVDMAPVSMVGKTGVAVTDLRPAGKVEIDGEVYDATSTGEFVHRHAHVKVVRYEAAQIYVTEEKTKKSQA